MHTVTINMELNDAQLARLMDDFRGRNGIHCGTKPEDGAGLGDDLDALFKNSYHPGEPKPATRPISYYEEKLAEAEAIIAQRDNQLAELKDALSIRGERADRQANTIADQADTIADQANTIADQAQTIAAYRLELRHAKRELEHLRNYCKDVADGVEEKLATIYGQTSIVGGDVHARTGAELQNIGYQLSQLLKEAERE